MTDPALPSPQAELRALAEQYVTRWYSDGEFANSVSAEPSRLANLLCDFACAPLFAARVAAIERDVEGKERYWIERAQEWVDRAVKAEAERTIYLARSVALEHELAAMTANIEAAGDELQAAWRATGEVAERVAAERTQAAAQALAEHEAYEDEKAQQRIEGGR